MAQLKIPYSDFTLPSSYHCRTTITTYYSDASHSMMESQKTNVTASDPVPESKGVVFEYELPAGSLVTSAKVYATVSNASYGAKKSNINGVAVGYGRDAVVDVALTEGATSVSVPFEFTTETPTHDHSWDELGQVVESGEYYDIRQILTPHTGYIGYTNIYLLIEYRPAYTPPELLPYTDPYPVKGETYVKAVHMTEIHENVNRIRVAMSMEPYAFMAITAREALLAGWNAHVEEIRAAVDEMGVDHEEWLALGDNYPRLDVLQQLRRVTCILADCYGGEDTAVVDYATAGLAVVGVDLE